MSVTKSLVETVVIGVVDAYTAHFSGIHAGCPDALGRSVYFSIRIIMSLEHSIYPTKEQQLAAYLQTITAKYAVGEGYSSVVEAYLSGVFNPDIGPIETPPLERKEKLVWRYLIPVKEARLKASPERSAITLHNHWLVLFKDVKEPTFKLIEDIRQGGWKRGEYYIVSEAGTNQFTPLTKENLKIEAASIFFAGGDGLNHHSYGVREKLVKITSYKEGVPPEGMDISLGFSKLEQQLLHATILTEWNRQYRAMESVTKQSCRDIVSEFLGEV